jgi:hypothetical protein
MSDKATRPNSFDNWLEFRLGQELGPISNSSAKGLPRYRALRVQRTQPRRFLASPKAATLGFVAAFALGTSGAFAVQLAGNVNTDSNQPKQTTQAQSDSQGQHGFDQSKQSSANANPSGSAYGWNCKQKSDNHDAFQTCIHQANGSADKSHSGNVSKPATAGTTHASQGAGNGSGSSHHGGSR